VVASFNTCWKPPPQALFAQANQTRQPKHKQKSIPTAQHGKSLNVIALIIQLGNFFEAPIYDSHHRYPLPAAPLVTTRNRKTGEAIRTYPLSHEKFSLNNKR